MAMPRSSDPTMLAVVAAKRAFITAVDNQVVKMQKALTNLAVDMSSLIGRALVQEGELHDALAKLARKHSMFQIFSLEFERQSRDANECFTYQLAFDQALELLKLAKSAVQCAPPESELANLLACEQLEALLNRLFPIVSYTQTYALRFVESCRFVANGSFVNCTEDMRSKNGRFSFVATPSTADSGSNNVLLGQATTFGLQSYALEQKENRFVCEQATNNHLQSRTWLGADEEWAAVSPFRSLEYARPLRVGDVFLLRSVGRNSKHPKFMTNPIETDHLVLRRSPTTLSYVVALSDAHGRFLYEP